MAMSGLTCCVWWLLFGVLLGWLASWLIDRLIGKGPSEKARVAAAPVRPADGIDHVAARAAGYVLAGPNSLEVIEGIGPSAAHLLRSNSINTFAQLAEMSAAALQAMLNVGGARFRRANPQTWPEQAALAAANRWADLRRLQDSLDAGVPPR